MPLTPKRTDGVSVVKAIDTNQIQDLLTGVMTDQPVAIANSVVAQSFTALPSGPYGAFLPGAPTVPTPAGVVTGKDLDYGGATWNVGAFGLKADGQEVTDAVMSAGSGIVTSASGKFKAADVGKRAFSRLVGAAVVANPTVAISGADGGVGGSNLPTGTYTFAYSWAIRGYSGATTAGTSAATYNQAVANHIITLTVPALPAGAEVTEIFCTVAPAGAFTGFLGLTNTTTFALVTGNTVNGRLPNGASQAGATLQTTIASYQSPTQVTLAATATLASPGTSFMWATDDSTLKDTAVAAVVAAGSGEVFLPPPPAGAWYLFGTGTTLNVPQIYFRGVYTKIFYTGSGDCFRVQMSPFGTNFKPGQFSSLVIDGWYSLDGANGIHHGDANQGVYQDVVCQRFNGVGSKGWWFDNRTNWCERTVLDRCLAQTNTANIVFDTNGGNVSFAHSFLYNLTQSMAVAGIGMQVKNSAALVNSLIHFTGNADVLSTTMQGLDTATYGYSTGANQYCITMENSGPAYAQAIGLDLAAGSGLFGQGVIDMSLGNYTNKNAGTTNIQFSGHLQLPGIYAMSGESFVVYNTGMVVVGASRIIGDTVALRLSRTAGALGGLLGFTDQVNGIKARVGISAVDNHAFMDDGTTERISWDGTGIGFFGHTRTAQPAAPVTLADVIAIIRGYGLSA